MEEKIPTPQKGKKGVGKKIKHTMRKLDSNIECPVALKKVQLRSGWKFQESGKFFLESGRFFT